MTERISLVIPSMGHADLLGRCLRSLAETGTRDYEVSIGFDAESVAFPTDFPPVFPIWYTRADRPGMHEAMESAVRIASEDWIVMVHDDMVFLPGWDDFPLNPNDILCFELLDEKGLTWPPAVELDGAAMEARLRQNAIVYRGGNLAKVVLYGGPFFGTSICHRSKWTPWPSWSGTKYGTHDTAWLIETHRAHPEVAFGWLPGRCLWHGISGSALRKAAVLPDDPDEFRRRYGTDTRSAEVAIFEHSRKLRGVV